MASDYHLAAALRLRVLGGLLAVCGVTVLLLVVAVALGAPAPVLPVGAVLLVAAAVGAGWWAGRAVVVRLGERGYRVRLVRGAGVREAAWRDVEDAVAVVVEGSRCVQIRLRDGRTTTLPVAALTGTPEAFVADLQRHLDRGHGYRRLPRRAG